MRKIFILFFVFCFLACLGSGGCKGKKLDESKTLPDISKSKKTKMLSHEPNHAPKIVEAQIVPDPAYTDNDLLAEVTAEDPEGDLINLKYQWIKFAGDGPVRTAVELEGETDQTLSHDKFVHGDVVALRITPFDWQGAEGQMFQTRLLIIRNSPPEIISSPQEDFSGLLYSYPVKVKDPDNDPITFSLSKDVPKGMTIDPSTGLVSWKIPPDTTGSFTIKVNGDDGHGGTCYQKLILSLTPPPSSGAGNK